MEKGNQRVMLTKRLLKEGLLRLLQQKKLGEINVSELCRESGINRATFYRHYDAPGDVLTEMGAELIGEIKGLAREITSIQEAGSCLEKICAYLYDNSDRIRLLVKYNTDEDLLKLLNEFQSRLWEVRGKVGEMETMDEESVKMASAYVSGGLYFLFRRWLIGEIRKTPQEIADFILNFAFRNTELGLA